MTTKVNEQAFDIQEDEEGVAQAAARLGPDGGPLVAVGPAYDEELEEFDEFDGDDAWLDEELTDEELAALGEEDFDEESLLIGEKSDDVAANIEAGVESTRSTQKITSLPDAEHRPPRAESPIHPLATATRSSEIVDSEFDSDSDFSLPGDDDLDVKPVPRISIHAFCDTQETTDLLENAAADRRLAKAHLTIHLGGVAKAIEHFQTAATPNLIVLETLDAGLTLFRQLGELAQVCDPSTKVIIIGRVNDITLYRELTRQGVSDYIVRPRTPLQIIKSIASLYVDPAAPPIGRTIAFVGSRGGVGSSTIAHNVAWAAAEEHHSDTVILDLDLPFGTVSLDFEQDPTSGLIEALTAPERLDDVLLDRLLQKHTERLCLFTAPNLLDRDYELDDGAYETVIDVLRTTAPTIIIDVPHIWTSWAKRVVQSADEIVITAAPDLASFRNTKNLVDVLSGSRPNDSPPILVLNQFDPKISSVQPKQFVEHVGLRPQLVIGWEPQLFHTAATNAAPILEVGSKTKTAQGLRDLTARVLGRTTTPAERTKFSFAGLFRKR